jgi:hypothetical protein
LITTDGDEHRLEDKLTQTFLVTRKEGFLQDDITRRLLAIRLRHEKPDRFANISKVARETYAELLSNPKTVRPEMIAIELLYQELQLLIVSLFGAVAEWCKLMANAFEGEPHAPISQTGGLVSKQGLSRLSKAPRRSHTTQHCQSW